MDPPVRVMGLHSLVYCERLHYLEEVEEVRLADASMYAGRSLHERWEAADPAEVEIRGLELTSEELGLTGRLDAARTRDGLLVPYEHKRGRAVRNADGSAEAWDTDVMQVTAYAMLLEEHVGRSVPEARIRYHTDNVTVRIPTTTERRSAVDAAVARAKELRSLTARPPVNENSRKCAACSLAPVCLPEEERAFGVRPAIRLFPEVDDRQFLHVVSQGARVQRAGERLKVTLDGAVIAEAPVRSVAGVVLHGNAQITTQAIHLCADQEIGVHWLTTGGRYVSGLASGAGSVQRRLRQYEALSDAGMCLELARRLAMNRVQSQLRFLLRATRGAHERRDVINSSIHGIRALLRQLKRADGASTIRGLEGNAGKHYFGALPLLIVPSLREALAPDGRSRKPPQDPFNAALSFGYALLYSRVLGAILTVGLDPAIGFFHTPRSAAHPLALDLMELFRVSLVDMPLVGSINRRQWHEEHFEVTKARTWLSEAGRRLAIQLFEERMQDSWKHTVLGYSLSYRRAIELEVRLLEKTWQGAPGLFASSVLR